MAFLFLSFFVFVVGGAANRIAVVVVEVAAAAAVAVVVVVVVVVVVLQISIQLSIRDGTGPEVTLCNSIDRVIYTCYFQPFHRIAKGS